MKQIALQLLTILLSGCTLTPEYQRPNIDIPSQWSTSNNSNEKTADHTAQDWWNSFENTELSALINEALVQNNDLLASMQRIEQSRANLKISGASILPTASISTSGSRAHTNPSQGKTTSSTSLQAGLNVSYEMDLFGKNQANIMASQEDLKVTQYDHEALSLVVMGDVASGYFTLLNLRERLKIADDNLNNAKEVMRIIQARVNEGTESELELAQQKSSVASNEATRISLAQQIKNAENALAVLLGKTPQSIVFKGHSLQELNIPEIAIGQPSKLLESRPDIRAAEAQLLSANADIGAARAAFYPTISLGGNNLISSSGFNDPATVALSLVSSIAAPMFQGGTLKGGLEKATARQEELVQNYKKTILVAFQETEDAIIAVESAQKRETKLGIAMRQSQKAYNLSKIRYDIGIIDFQTLLDTQNSQLLAEDSFSQAKLERLQASILLFKALGRGWI